MPRKRYRLVQAVLPAHRVGGVAEIGYGGGIFLPELARHCETLQGIDVHPFNEAVTAQAARNSTLRPCPQRQQQTCLTRIRRLIASSRSATWNSFSISAGPPAKCVE